MNRREFLATSTMTLAAAALKGVPGVTEAAVDFDSGTASALVPESLDVEVLVASLHFDKYSARVHEAAAAN